VGSGSELDFVTRFEGDDGALAVGHRDRAALRDFFGLPLRFMMFTRVTLTLKVCSTAARTVCLFASGYTSKVYWP